MIFLILFILLLTILNTGMLFWTILHVTALYDIIGGQDGSHAD